MDRQRLDQALARNRLLSIGEAVGRKFVFEYKEPNGEWGVIAGTIIAVGLFEDDGEDHVALYISVPGLPTVTHGDEVIDCLLANTDNGTWSLKVGLESDIPWPIGTLELL